MDNFNAAFARFGMRCDHRQACSPVMTQLILGTSSQVHGDYIALVNVEVIVRYSGQ